MATTNPTTEAINRNYDSSDSDVQARGGRRTKALAPHVAPTAEEPLPHLTKPAGTLLKGATDAEGKQKDPALLLGIKLDLDAEIHLTARVRGDIAIGLY
ncbi:hypothetical protein HDK90DRAFT_537707 [Phyllosticta capitalensis]|uniref:Uncharacterized protein n=1 Tax=Phyllosticta capitalensis TaxID=121624 RepID=A0ABR1YA95_9PEZI